MDSDSKQNSSESLNKIEEVNAVIVSIDKDYCWEGYCSCEVVIKKEGWSHNLKIKTKCKYDKSIGDSVNIGSHFFIKR